MITQRSTSTGNVVTQEAITLRDTEISKGQRTRLFSFPLFKEVYIPPKQTFWPFIRAQLHSKTESRLLHIIRRVHCLFVVVRLSMLAVFNVNFNRFVKFSFFLKTCHLTHFLANTLKGNVKK